MFFFVWMLEAVTPGFLSILLHFFCPSVLPCTVQALAGLPCHLNLGKSLHGWLTAEGWHAPGARAGDQKMAVFTYHRDRVLPGCSWSAGLKTSPWSVCCREIGPGPEPSRKGKSYFPSRKWMTKVAPEGGVENGLRRAPVITESRF